MFCWTELRFGLIWSAPYFLCHRLVSILRWRSFGWVLDLVLVVCRWVGCSVGVYSLFSWIPTTACFICNSTQLLTVELYIMILEVTLTCILMQDEYLERLVFSSVSFTCLSIYLLLSCWEMLWEVRERFEVNWRRKSGFFRAVQRTLFFGSSSVRTARTSVWTVDCFVRTVCRVVRTTSRGFESSSGRSNGCDVRSNGSEVRSNNHWEFER